MPPPPKGSSCLSTSFIKPNLLIGLGFYFVCFQYAIGYAITCWLGLQIWLSLDRNRGKFLLR